MLIKKSGERELVRWLTGGHLQEVASQPGFGCAQLLLVRSSDSDAEYLAIYEVESSNAFESYEANVELKERFAQQRERFDRLLRVERSFARVVAGNS